MPRPRTLGDRPSGHVLSCPLEQTGWRGWRIRETESFTKVTCLFTNQYLSRLSYLANAKNWSQCMDEENWGLKSPLGLLTPHVTLPLGWQVDESERESVSCSVVFDSVTPWTVAARLLCPWDFSGKNTGVDCHFLLQGIFPAQKLNPCLLL